MQAVEKEQKKKKALVTGGAGFIGSNLVDYLIEKGWDVVIIDNLSTGKKENLNPEAEFFNLDICDLEKIKPIFNEVDYVFHLAALPRIQISIDDPIGTSKVNFFGTLNVLMAARDAGVKKVIYSSSSSVYGPQEKLPWHEDMFPNPISPYGSQKYFGEIYCKLFSEIYGLPTVCLRYFNVYGRRQADEGAYCPVISVFVRQRLSGQPMSITGDGGQSRDYTNVDDVVLANFLSAESEKVGKGDIINIGRGQNYKIKDIAEMIGGPKIHTDPRLEVKHSLADTQKARELLNWEPRVNLPDWIMEYKKEINL